MRLVKDSGVCLSQVWRCWTRTKLEDYDNFTYEDEQEPTPPVSRQTYYDDEQQLSPPMTRHHSSPGPLFAQVPQGPYIFSAGPDRLDESLGRLKEEQIEIGDGFTLSPLCSLSECDGGK